MWIRKSEHCSEKEKSDEVKDGKYTRREFNYTSFSRSFALPETVKLTTSLRPTPMAC
ncbi:MAG: Hsp20/alpha crystallin family protein [Saprospiraceae bacterium]|nr:Hsp20/alpha crystallin family protein [Saprospiraceae bacterium]